MLIKQVESAGRCFVKRSVCEVFFPVDEISAACVYLARRMTEFTHDIYFMHVTVSDNHSLDQLWFLFSLLLEVEEGEMVGLLVPSLTLQVGLDAL